MSEHIDGRLARIEEHLRETHTLVQEIHGRLTPLVNKHEREIGTLKRDRWWVFTLVGAAFAALMSYMGLKN